MLSIDRSELLNKLGTQNTYLNNLIDLLSATLLIAAILDVLYAILRKYFESPLYKKESLYSMHKITKDEIVMLVWDLPMWVLDEIKWGIYNRCKALAIKLGLEP